jgi:hypothetical protein
MSQGREILFGGVGSEIAQSQEASDPSGGPTLPPDEEAAEPRRYEVRFDWPSFGWNPRRGGVASEPMFVEVHDPSGKKNWFQIHEQAYIQLSSSEEMRAEFGDPDKGATLEQAWRTTFLQLGYFPTCLLASGRPPVSTAKIRQTVLIPPSQLVEILARAFASVPRCAIVTFVFDSRMGHCITLFDHDPSTSSFIFHDPWPKYHYPHRSLLCRENNAAGVAAVPTDGLWRITESELRSVVFATFVFPSTWAELSGVKYKVPYLEFKASEFWDFFNVQEQVRQEYTDKWAIVHLKTGGFRDEIELQVLLDMLYSPERIHSATLGLRRRWIMGEPWGVNPYACDVAKSFVAALTPEPDREYAEPLIEGLWALADPESARSLAEQRKNLPAADSPSVDQLLTTYLGGQPENSVHMPFSLLNAKNVDRKGESWLELKFSLW